MANFTRTFRKSGSHQAESSDIDGVQIKIGEKFRPPKKVTLPVGWHQKDPSDVLSLTYNFSLEREVLRMAEEEKAKKEQEAASIIEAAMAATSTQSEIQPSISTETKSASKPNPVFTNMGTDILTPVTVTGSGHKRVDSTGSKGKNSFNISDFEGEASTPFELVELQTINDMDELKSVLATSTIGGGPPQPSSNSFTVMAASSGSGVVSSASVAATGTQYNSNNNYLVNIPSNTPGNASTVAPSTNFDLGETVSGSDFPGNTLVDISEPCGELVTPKGPIGMSVNSTSGFSHSLAQVPVPLPHASQNQLFSVLQPPGQVAQNPLLVGIGEQSQAPCNPPVGYHSPPVSSATGKSPVASQGGLIPSDRLGQGAVHLPPLQSPPQIPPRPWVSQAASRGSTSVDGVKAVGGVRVLPSNSGPLPYPAMSSSSPPTTCRRGPVVSPLPEPLPQLGGDPRQHSSPLPPIGSPEPTNDSSLPDPWPVLSESERTLVTSIASMGFPAPRVARAVQRLGEKDREIVDFLVAVDEVSQLGHPPDCAEVALTLNSMDKKKALEFLELEKTFKEWGFKQDNIQEALRAADNDRDKALDYLMTLQSAA